MGQSTNAILAYGYNLGGDDDEWLVEEAGEYGELDSARLAWFDPEEDDAGFIEAAQDHLLATSGFTETDWHVDGYFDRKKAAKEAIGVHIESYCSINAPMYILAAHEFTVYQGDITEIDFASLAQQAIDGSWDTKLANALQVLGLTPKQTKPAWLLCSYWG